MEHAQANGADAIDGPAAREIRLRLELSLRAFWGAIAVHYSSGSSYENRQNAMPGPVKRLVYLHYVLGFPTDITKEEFTAAGGPAHISKVRALTSSMRSALALTTQAAALLQEPLEKSV